MELHRIGFARLALVHGIVLFLVNLCAPLISKWGRGELSQVLIESVGEAFGATLVVGFATTIAAYIASRKPRSFIGTLWPSFWAALLSGAAVYGSYRQAGVFTSKHLEIAVGMILLMAIPHLAAVYLLWRGSAAPTEPTALA